MSKITKDGLVRAMYAAWPHTVHSQALAEITGLQIGETIDFDAAVKAGATFGGLERYAEGAVALIEASTADLERQLAWADNEAVPLLCAIKATLAADEMDDAGRRHFIAEIEKSFRSRTALAAIRKDG